LTSLTITLHGESVAVLMSRETFERLSNPQLNLVEFMRASPLFGLDDLRFERTDSLAREIEL
jgi:hypothetical protein